MKYLLWWKFPISKLNKIIAPVFLLYTVIFIALGISLIINGVNNVLTGGYADNILIGVFSLFMFPLLTMMTYLLIIGLGEKNSGMVIKQ